jgi:hypothetical protein
MNDPFKELFALAYGRACQRCRTREATNYDHDNKRQYCGPCYIASQYAQGRYDGIPPTAEHR